MHHDERLQPAVEKRLGRLREIAQREGSPIFESRLLPVESKANGRAHRRNEFKVEELNGL